MNFSYKLRMHQTKEDKMVNFHAIEKFQCCVRYTFHEHNVVLFFILVPRREIYMFADDDSEKIICNMLLRCFV